MTDATPLRPGADSAFGATPMRGGFDDDDRPGIGAADATPMMKVGAALAGRQWAETPMAFHRYVLLTPA